MPECKYLRDSMTFLGNQDFVAVETTSCWCNQYHNKKKSMHCQYKWKVFQNQCNLQPSWSLEAARFWFRRHRRFLCTSIIAKNNVSTQISQNLAVKYLLYFVFWASCLCKVNKGVFSAIIYSIFSSYTAKIAALPSLNNLNNTKPKF